LGGNMQKIKYSVLSSDCEVIKKTDIDSLLADGIKVLFFGESAEVTKLESGREKYKKAKLLQTYVVNNAPIITVIDGDTSSVQKDFDLLAKATDAFNREQYDIEHASSNINMIIEAGAGTGKTTVMVDRILFLLHTVPGLEPCDIGMITFTNEATQNMKHKIQEVLLTRYRATHNPKYLGLMESGNDFNIKTIHAFSKDMIAELGTALGYGKGMKIRGFKNEKREIILDILNDLFGKSNHRVETELGLKTYEIENLVMKFWARMNNLGLLDSEILSLDWGDAVDDSSEALHNTLKGVFREINEKYDEVKKLNDAITVEDIVRELKQILSESKNLVMKSHPLKYLFVDEFQDSDNAQIQTLAWLYGYNRPNMKLFVVGDIKQSIYRFRGAVETAFMKLEDELKKFASDGIVHYPLLKNYRTADTILDRLDPIFESWGKQGLLNYDTKLIAQAGVTAGRVKFNAIPEKQRGVEIAETIKKCLADSEKKRLEYEKLNGKEKDFIVTVLTRTNFQLADIEAICAKQAIPCYIKKEGTFYNSAAVKDFLTMVKAYLFSTSSDALFDYAMSSYVECDIDLKELRKINSSEEKMLFLRRVLSHTQYPDYLKDFRLRPALACLNDIIENLKPIKGYLRQRKGVLISQGDWSDDELNTQLAIDANQYSANLDKLMQILRDHFGGQIASLYNIYNFIVLHMNTDTSEDDADLPSDTKVDCLHGMTVHKSKGLEFDTVIISYTHRTYRRDKMTEILLDDSSRPYKIGWSNVKREKEFPYDVISEHKNK